MPTILSHQRPDDSSGERAALPHSISRKPLIAHLAALAAQHPERPAIYDINGAALTYGALYQFLATTSARLNEAGIGRHDRVAIVLPNGPVMATTFLAVAATATSAPLNPAYRAAEYEFALVDLNARAVLVDAGLDSPVREVARANGIPILELSTNPASVGLFTLAGGVSSPPASTGLAEADDIALILHTSGTTSRPKMVPLTQRNLWRSANNIVTTLALSPADRCLNIMPLFHIHGLVAALLASLAAGGSVVCTPGFDAPRFFSWLHECRPTWYTGVPTMHQAILARAAIDKALSQQARLRFVRSSSAPLPPIVMAALEETFHAPVIEAYGMTEAAHQMASNPLPPLARKAGSVGMAAGPEVAIMAEGQDRLLAANATGEVVIRGENVTQGYLNNEAANANAFAGGWFRTGDQGYLDDAGYLFLTGRLKELINRGGEKIAPREVDEVLLAHPAVAQAVTFAMPDEKLGEEVAAAVVLRDKLLRDKEITEPELRRFVASHLADFKVPRRVLILDEIPKGPTGKLQRIGLAEKLGLATNATSAPPEQRPFRLPRTPNEQQLVELWCEILKLPAVSINQPFLEAGGDSMMAIQLVTRIQQSFAIRLSVVDLFDAPTIADQAIVIESILNEAPDRAAGTQLLRLIQKGKAKNHPLFFVPGGGGGESEFLVYARLIHLLGADQPVYGFFARGLDGLQLPHATVEELVTDYLHALRTVQPQGPYFLTGECVGGKVAFEMARLLAAQGDEVALLLLLNTQFSQDESHLRPPGRNAARLRMRLNHHWAELQRRSFAEQAHYLWQRWQASPFNPLASKQPQKPHADAIQQAHAHYNQMLRRYLPHEAYSGPVTLLVSQDHYRRNPTMGFNGWAAGGLELVPLPGDLYSYLGRHVQTTAKQMRLCLAEAQRRTNESKMP